MSIVDSDSVTLYNGICVYFYYIKFHGWAVWFVKMNWCALPSSHKIKKKYNEIANFIKWTSEKNLFIHLTTSWRTKIDLFENSRSLACFVVLVGNNNNNFSASKNHFCETSKRLEDLFISMPNLPTIMIWQMEKHNNSRGAVSTARTFQKGQTRVCDREI